VDAIQTIEGGHIASPRGFLAGATSAGIKAAPGALDLALLYSERNCASAAVFTRNQVKGAPVIVTQRRAAAGRLRAVVVNSGCSNSLTGEAGIADAEEMADLAAQRLGLAAEEVGVASTGVTGVRLPMDKVRAALPRLALAADGGPAFARAIMTTDTRPKEVAATVATPWGRYTVAGCAKGSGMIHPDMATMLAYVTTDAEVERGLLQRLVREAADATFNMVTVDGDTSCSDTLLVFANGAAEGPPIDAASEEAGQFAAALLAVCTHLSRELARDGEGATRLMEVVVRGARNVADARRAARTIASSPLVKTAVAGCDPNWGRILVAAGRSGAELREERCSLRLQGEPLLERGLALPFDEAAMRARLDAPEVRIELDLGLGEMEATAWGCDLTDGYVHINADYTT
jgi:glutamate N-acetyltransferase/amino-acid N-acetyltransferase